MEVSMSRHLINRSAAVAMAVAMLFGSVATVFATVSTDAYYYNFGDTVQITGDGMQTGESVSVGVSYPGGTLAQEHQVVADENGNFADSFYLADGMPYGEYAVVATGLASGNVFSTVFDPPKGFGVNVSGDNSAWVGQTKTYTAVTTGACSGPFSWSWSVGAASTGTATINASGNSADFTFTGAGTVIVTATATDTGPDDCVGPQNGTKSVTASNVNTALTLTFDPVSPITYGQSTTLSGELTDTTGTTGVAGQNITVTQNSAAGCTGSTSATLGTFATVGGATTPPKGDWTDPTPYRPSAAGDLYFLASFVGTGAQAPASACATLTTSKASTSTSVTNTPSSSINLGDSFSINYGVTSSYGISGNTTVGTVSLTQVSGPTSSSLCADTDTLSAAQSDASGTGTGFNATGTLTCTPDTVGTYTYHVNYGGETNYLGSASSPDLTVQVTVAYTTNGFFAPVDMNGVLNKAKAGQTIPLKFDIIDGDGNPVANDTSLVDITVRSITCDTTGVETDVIEYYSTSASGLRWDATAQQYVFNFATQKAWAGTCKTVTLYLDGGEAAVAYFNFTR
jgi:hypothetical protein